MAKYITQTQFNSWTEYDEKEDWFEEYYEETIILSFNVKGLKDVHVRIEDCGDNKGRCETRLVLANINSRPVTIRFKKGTTITSVTVAANYCEDYDIDKEDVNWLVKCLAETEIYASRF